MASAIVPSSLPICSYIRTPVSNDKNLELAMRIITLSMRRSEWIHTRTLYEYIIHQRCLTHSSQQARCLTCNISIYIYAVQWWDSGWIYIYIYICGSLLFHSSRLLWLQWLSLSHIVRLCPCTFIRNVFRAEEVHLNIMLYSVSNLH